MFNIFAIVSMLAIAGNCQLLRDEERPTRYILPYSGLEGADEPEVEEKHYYKPNRRAERIPATAYRYDEAEEEYYRPQPRQKVETDTYTYQPAAPSHKDYEEILKRNHLARLRVAAKKQSHAPSTPAQQPQQPQQPVEQYLKEVNPTTKTAAYQRPSNYLRFGGQSALKQEQNEETPLKQQSYRYVLQPELQQQKSYPQYQYEAQQETVKPKTPHFNLVAYQNALLAQQKLLAAESQGEGPSKSPIYTAQSPSKKAKKQKTPSRQSNAQQYDYYPQVPPQRPTYTPEPAAARYQQPLTPRNLFSKNEATFQVEDSLLYPEHKELEYQTQATVRATKQRTTRPPRRKPKYQTEEPQEEYQRPIPKYQPEDQYDYQSGALKDEDEPVYRRPLPRPTKPAKYEEQTDAKDDYLYQPLPKYQRESLVRRPVPYEPEPEVTPNRYLSRRQYQEESKPLPQYEVADLAFQPSVEVPARQGRGPSVSYRRTYPQNRYDRRQQFITTPQPNTRHFHSVDYPNPLIAEQPEEESSAYITNKPSQLKTQKVYPSTQHKFHTAARRQTNLFKLAPVSYGQTEETNGYEPGKPVEDTDTMEHWSVAKQMEDPENRNASELKYNPQNIIKKKGLHYPRRPKKFTYLNGQFFREEVKPPQYEDLVTQSSADAPVRYVATRPFLVVVYDE